MKTLFDCLFAFAEYIIDLVPTVTFETIENVGTLKSILMYVYIFVPQDAVLVVVAHIVTYLTIGTTVSIYNLCLRAVQIVRG